MRNLLRSGACAAAWALLLVAPGARADVVELPHFLTVDVPAVSVEGAFLQNGVPFPTEYGNLGVFRLESSLDAQPLAIGQTTDPSYGPVWVVAGDYTPTYEHLFSDGQIPINVDVAVSADLSLASSSVAPIDVDAIDVTFDLTLDGLPFPPDPTETAQLRLRRAGTDVEFPIGWAHQGSISVRIVPGVYDVVYDHQSGSGIPQNQHAVLVSGLSLLSDQSVAVDVQTASHTMSFLLNGAPFPVSLYADGEIFLRRFSTGDSVSFGLTSQPSATRTVLPGTYAVTWTRDGLSDLVPANSNAVVRASLPIRGGASVSTLDVQAAAITLAATLNGAPFPGSNYEKGEIVLVGPNDDVVPLGETNDASPDAVLVVEGTYDVHYRRLFGTSIVPRNPDARLSSGLVVEQDGTLELDVPAIEITPVFTLDGAAFPSSAYERGDLVLRGEVEGDEVPLGSSHEAPDPVFVVPGVYDVVYDWQQGTNLVPRNTDHVLLRDLALLGTQQLDIDVPTKLVVPTFTLNAGPFPGPAVPAERGHFYLRTLEGGELPLGPSDATPPDSVLAIEGAYLVEYDWSAGLGVPRNVGRRLGTTAVPEPAAAHGLLAGAALLGAMQRRRSRAPGRPRP